MNMQEIALICELVNYKSFADAAYCLSYSPSAITKYVCSVEEELGVKLFIRGNKSRDLVLTREGAEIVEAMGRICGEYNNMLEMVDRIKSDTKDSISIGSQPRFGNIHEQKIIAAFMLHNPKTKIHLRKGAANDLIQNLLTGKIDAAFVTLHHELELDRYFGEAMNKLEMLHITSERDMYMGIADKYLPGKTEACMMDFEGFTFAFPFPHTDDQQNVKAASTWFKMANERGMQLKTLYVEGYDNTIFQMASMKPIAVTTTSVPARHEGIKFVKLIDWIGCTNLYLLHLKNNKSAVVKSLRKSMQEYKNSLADEGENA